MRIGVVTKKLGMTRLLQENGTHVPVTILQMDKTVVVGHKNIAQHGYNAVILGTRQSSIDKLNKPEGGFFKKNNLPACKILKEFRVSAENILDVGTEIGIQHFQIGQYIDITSTSIGKGFAGVMKRWNFGGLRASHGVSVSHRSHGSTGNRQDPGKVFAGKKMAGHLGCDTVTVQNMQIVGIDESRSLYFVKGAVPGGENATVYVKDAIKKKSKV